MWPLYLGCDRWNDETRRATEDLEVLHAQLGHAEPARERKRQVSLHSWLHTVPPDSVLTLCIVIPSPVHCPSHEKRCESDVRMASSVEVTEGTRRRRRRRRSFFVASDVDCAVGPAFTREKNTNIDQRQANHENYPVGDAENDVKVLKRRRWPPSHVNVRSWHRNVPL